MEIIGRIKELTKKLNDYRDSYYNKSVSVITDYEYDKLFDELQQLEVETGFIMTNSPTQTVGYEVKSELKKVQHNHPMLSLDKTKSIEDIQQFLAGERGIVMLKMDGLTISLKYVNGELVSAETRGNGIEGEDVTHNAKVFSNIPLYINWPGELIVDGEAIISYDDFETINANLPEDKRYKNPRNLASGSVRQLDSSVTQSRKIKFIAWKCIKGIETNSHYEDLDKLEQLGFDVVPRIALLEHIQTKECLEATVKLLQTTAKLKENLYPIDGLVFGYDDIRYGKSLGATGHHLRSQMAFKFYDEEFTTILKEIEWSMGKTGTLTPVAVFEPVEIDGTIVERASVHNVSIYTSLELLPGDEIEVYKANQIIPQIKRNLSAENRKGETVYLQLPGYCPICDAPTKTEKDNDTTVLMCTNPNCKGKLLGRLKHFVSKNAINITGLSEATLEKFIELGWLNSFKDVFHLKEHKQEMMNLPGFGKKSTEKLLESIEAAKETTLDRFIYSLSIDLIGRTASKTISKFVNNQSKLFHVTPIECFLQLLSKSFEWDLLDDFGAVMKDSINEYGLQCYSDVEELAIYFSFEQKIAAVVTTDDLKDLTGKIFVITGSLNHFKNRDEAKEEIEKLNGKVAGSVSAKTSYLVNNDVNSSSGKNKKAKELGIPIISEEQLLAMIR